MLETALASVVAGGAALRAKVAALCAVRGVGTITATALLASLPGLEALSKAQAAALAGLAPFKKKTVATLADSLRSGGQNLKRPPPCSAARFPLTARLAACEMLPGMSSPTVSQIPAAFYAASSALGYLLGSIPTGYLVGRRYGIDIREHGSGNIGATNVVRVLGKKPGYFVFACDMLKGLLSTFLGLWIARVWHPGIMDVDVNANQVHPHFPPLISPEALGIAAILGALCCILGHNFPVWLRFRGGKGVATTVGVLLGLMPAAFLVAAIAWGATFYLSRYVSLASLAAAAVLPVTVWWFTWRASVVHSGIGPLFWFSVVAAALVFLRHRANITRLLNGTESRFAPKPKTAGTR